MVSRLSENTEILLKRVQTKRLIVDRVAQSNT